MPVFAQVTHLYLVDEKIVFGVNHLQTCSFNPHYHAFYVKVVDNVISYVLYDKLLSLYHLKSVPGIREQMIVLKHRLIVP